MSPAGRPPRFSVQTKVLVPVMAFLIVMPAILLWIVSGQFRKQVLAEGRQTLMTADNVFRQAIEARSRELADRLSHARNEPDFKGLAQVAAAGESPYADKTFREHFEEQLRAFGDDAHVMYFTYAGSGHSVGAVSDGEVSLGDFTAAGQVVTRGVSDAVELSRGLVTVNGLVYFVSSVPLVTVDTQERVGTLTVGVRMTDAAIDELRYLARAEILFFSGDKLIAASSMAPPDAALPSAQSKALDPTNEPMVFNGERYLKQNGDFEKLKSMVGGVHYVLLVPLEKELQSLNDTCETLALISILGVLVSAAVVWYIVRRITHPLRQLAESAEAVGRGDFTRRIDVTSNDECGDLAHSFNGMTENLQGSRAELEKTVETLKNTQTQLIQSEKLSAVGQFVAGVAHELNNPLTAVIGFSDLLSKTSTDEAIAPHLDLISKSALRCHKIVQNLLSFARQHPPERKLVQLNAALDSVLEIMAYDFRTSNISIIRQFAADLPSTIGDSHQLQQVFVNILGNARQAIQGVRQDGQITVRTFVNHAMVVIEFADNGPGIRPENLAKIFDPFFTTKPVGKGTGLGLSLTYGIVREHGGRISVQSVYGQGATFTIELPMASGSAVVQGELAQRPARPPALAPSGKKVLVVDDEEWILTLAERLLTLEGHVVVLATGGEKAVEAIQSQSFDVVVSDWKMPGMNGIQLYEHLKITHPVLAEKMIFMTGDVVNEAFTTFLERNRRVCIPKPFAIEDFQEAVETMLSTGA